MDIDTLIKQAQSRVQDMPTAEGYSMLAIVLVLKEMLNEMRMQTTVMRRQQ